MSVPFPPAPEPPKPAGQVCAKCDEFKPLDEFCRKGDGYGTECKHCYNVRNRASTEAYKQMHAAVGGTKLSAPHITELCDKMIQRFGGLDGFADYWHAQIEAARNRDNGKGAGSKTVLDSLNNISKLVVMSTEHRGSAPDTSDLSDADLEREFEEAGERVLLKIHKDQNPPAPDDKQSA